MYGCVEYGGGTAPGPRDVNDYFHGINTTPAVGGYCSGDAGRLQVPYVREDISNYRGGGSRPLGLNGEKLPHPQANNCGGSASSFDAVVIGAVVANHTQVF